MKNSFPIFVLENIEELSQYLIEKFSYTPVFSSDWYIQLDCNGQQLGLMIQNSSNQPDILHKPCNGEGVIWTLEVEDVDNLYKNFDAEVVHELQTEEWGQRHFIIRAPQNILIDVVNYTEPEDYNT